MADGHGGHRTPHNPAPASGPGRLSKRTDGGPGQKLEAPTGMPYGDHQALMAQERTSAMSQADPVPQISVPAAQQTPQGSAGPPPQMPPFGGPSTRPDEPVTHGVDIGAGAGSNIIGGNGMPAPNAAAGTGQMTALLRGLSATDTTGILGQLMEQAAARNA